MYKIFVGNLSFSATEDSVRSLFTQYGTVESVAILTDRDTGQPRGFGFVEMSDSSGGRKAIASGGRKAIAGLNDTDFEGRTLKVSEARPREDRGSGAGERGPRFHRY
jgi:RNA recognition motif-containing protein